MHIFIKKKILSEVFSTEFWKKNWNNFLMEHLRAAFLYNPEKKYVFKEVWYNKFL